MFFLYIKKLARVQIKWSRRRSGERIMILKRIWKEAVVVYLSYYPVIFLGGLKKTTKSFGQDSRSPGRDTRAKLQNKGQEYCPLGLYIRYFGEEQVEAKK
jgi:hypothetical protein